MRFCRILPIFVATACLGLAVPVSAAVILTANFTGAAGTQPSGFSAYVDGMTSQNDGSGEYEQKRLSALGTAIAAYQVLDDIDTGAWRDVTLTTLTRFSGGADNDNGLVFRARGVSGTTSGDFYHVRFQADALELVRFEGGTGAVLKSQATTESIASPTNRWLRVSVQNVPRPNTDYVKIHAELSKTADFSQIIGTLDYLDNSASAITRAGGVGYRSYNTSATSGARSVYDNLVVDSDKPDLLWFDDYNDDTAPRMTSYLAGTRTQSITNQKYQFDGAGNAIALIDFPAETSGGDWGYVRASAMMRLNTMSATREDSGLIFRANGVDSANDGDGNYYFYRLRRQEDVGAQEYVAELLRHNEGVGLTLLDSVSIGAAGVPESQNIFLQVDSIPDSAGLRIMTKASLSPDFSNPLGVFNFLDSSPNALWAPGSVGYRVGGSGAANFDNLTVTAIPEPAAMLLLGLGAMVLLTGRRRFVSRASARLP